MDPETRWNVLLRESRHVSWDWDVRWEVQTGGGAHLEWFADAIGFEAWVEVFG
jgi:hypothetical protein